MKYLIISAISLAGILALSLRNTNAETKPLASVVELRPTDLGENTDAVHTEFNEYWYEGLAELSGYDLKQFRYSEVHEGTATMVFVTEPFSKKKQVKLDNPGQAGKDNLPVLKLNKTRNFLTGIYPYSMMTSVFSPVNNDDYEGAVKVSLSGQEWCGHVFQQMNLQGSKYKVKAFSYFESEGDQEFSVDKTYLEDEMFNLIRLNPAILPKGDIKVIPSSVVSRLVHEEFKAYDAKASVSSDQFNGIDVNTYQLEYTHNGRILKIHYQKEFPYLIEGWEDTYKAIFGKEAKSIASRKNTKKLPYWSLHNNKDRPLNAELYQ